MLSARKIPDQSLEATAMLILVNVLGGTLRIDSQLLIMD